jgi:uncharacterized protein YcaQ
VTTRSVSLTPAQARAVWLRAQRLDTRAPFGDGPVAVQQAIEHLGYVQIDTINVIERCHHHILYTRLPGYRRHDLATAQSADKSVFEYWTHALAYVPTGDYRFFVPAMRRHREAPSAWYAAVEPAAYRRLLRRIRTDGPLSIRDVDDDVLVEKDHPWASRKPSKRVLQLAFYTGDLVISARAGMLKTYELTGRHFGWTGRPRAATDSQYAAYLLARALRAQGLVSLDSICYGEVRWKRLMAPLVEAEMRRRRLVPVQLDGAEKPHWAAPATLDDLPGASEPLVHILSPFDPLVIQRPRLAQFFGYEHRFEAYVPADKRVLGYFALPVLVGDRIVAALDLKTDRQARQLRVQRWTWVAAETPALKQAIEGELHRFEAFQLA